MRRKKISGKERRVREDGFGEKGGEDSIADGG